MADPTQRFTGRVEDYTRYRPGYPPGILDLLRRECEFTEKAVVADVGSGTGILSRLFLDNGNKVTMVEPNDEIDTQVYHGLLAGGGEEDGVRQSRRGRRSRL